MQKESRLERCWREQNRASRMNSSALVRWSTDWKNCAEELQQWSHSMFALPKLNLACLHQKVMLLAALTAGSMYAKRTVEWRLLTRREGSSFSCARSAANIARCGKSRCLVLQGDAKLYKPFDNPSTSNAMANGLPLYGSRVGSGSPTASTPTGSRTNFLYEGNSTVVEQTITMVLQSGLHHQVTNALPSSLPTNAFNGGPIHLVTLFTPPLLAITPDSCLFHLTNNSD
uniref:Uncharacterized protein n=1 Tax=Ditylenchus dipsaci TaxID=166011 RepID=A0A915DG12_9BILA